MSIKRKKILSLGNDINITIALDNMNDMYGYEQENNNLIDRYGKNLINKPIDYEVHRFKYGLSSGNIRFYFYDGNEYKSNYISCGFTEQDILYGSNAFRNSFYIMDIYDGYNQYTQNKLYSGYLTKLFIIDSIFFNINFNTLNKKVFQLNKIQIPINYLDNIDSDYVILYTSFRFYNAKSGKLHNFYNYNYPQNRTPINQYYKIKLNLIDMKWNFVGNNNQTITNINLREFIISTSYNDRINNTLKSIDEKQQDYPKGDNNLFNPSTGKYD